MDISCISRTKNKNPGTLNKIRIIASDHYGHWQHNFPRNVLNLIVFLSPGLEHKSHPGRIGGFKMTYTQHGLNIYQAKWTVLMKELLYLLL